MKSNKWYVCLIVWTTFVVMGLAGQANELAQLLNQQTISGGIISYLGSGDTLPDGLDELQDQFIIQLLDVDGETVDSLRESVLNAYGYGKVIANTYDAKHLP